VQGGEGVATKPKHGKPAMPRGRFHVLLNSYEIFISIRKLTCFRMSSS
jgi:hypothetical protein